MRLRACEKLLGQASACASESERSSFTTVMLIIPWILSAWKHGVLAKQNIQKHKEAAWSTSDKACVSALAQVSLLLCVKGTLKKKIQYLPRKEPIYISGEDFYILISLQNKIKNHKKWFGLKNIYNMERCLIRNDNCQKLTAGSSPALRTSSRPSLPEWAEWWCRPRRSWGVWGCCRPCGERWSWLGTFCWGWDPTTATPSGTGWTLRCCPGLVTEPGSAIKTFWIWGLEVLPETHLWWCTWVAVGGGGEGRSGFWVEHVGKWTDLRL